VVRDGLALGERIVVSGLQRVRPGATVTPVEAKDAVKDEDPTASAKPGNEKQESG